MPIHSINAQQPANAEDLFQRYMRFQREMLERVQNDGAPGGLDEERLMTAALQSEYSPHEWSRVEMDRKANVSNVAANYWNQTGQVAKQRWLAETKASEEAAQPAALAKVELVAPEVAMPLHEAIRPHNVKKAYQGIFADLGKWNELPEGTTAEKLKVCFLSPERIGAIVCSALLLIVLVVFIVILTL